MEQYLLSLQNQLDEDDELAWGYHCKIAGAAQDEGIDWLTSQRIARRAMYIIFACGDYSAPEGINEYAVGDQP